MSEKSLHAVIKKHLEPDETKHEIRIGRFIADIATHNKIIEIQTRSFNMLRKRLDFYLNTCQEKSIGTCPKTNLGTYHVVLVYPLPRYKWLYWINKETNEITKKRKSPKIGSIYDAIGELYKIKSFLNHENLCICLIFVDLKEYRYLDGWSGDKKKGSTRCDRVPVNIVEEINLDNVEDYHIFIHDALPEQFTSKDYVAFAKVNIFTAQTTLNILDYLGIVKRVGKQGRTYVYERSKL